MNFLANFHIKYYVCKCEKGGDVCRDIHIYLHTHSYVKTMGKELLNLKENRSAYGRVRTEEREGA